MLKDKMGAKKALRSASKGINDAWLEDVYGGTVDGFSIEEMALIDERRRYLESQGITDGPDSYNNREAAWRGYLDGLKF